MRMAKVRKDFKEGLESLNGTSFPILPRMKDTRYLGMSFIRLLLHLGGSVVEVSLPVLVLPNLPTSLVRIFLNPLVRAKGTSFHPVKI